MGRSKTQDEISKNMKNIKNKDTKIELLLRKELWSRGLRYRKNLKSVTGKPDIAFPSVKVAVFCDSEFWHGYNWGEKRKQEFKSNSTFWILKIERNMQRDNEVTQKLQNDGWVVLRFWGKEIKQNLQSCVNIIEETIISRKKTSIC